MRLKPIFDTNIFGHVQSGQLNQSDWQFLLRHRPQHGWPASLITVLEVLAGLDGLPPEKFNDIRVHVQLLFDVSKGRILDEPTRLLCSVLRIPFPPSLVAPAPPVLYRYMDVIRRATSLAQLLTGVPYKGRFAVMDTVSAVNSIVADLKKKSIDSLELMATEKNPEWRELFEKEGRRLPPEMRRELEPRSAWEAQKHAFTEDLVRHLLRAAPEPALIHTVLT